MEVCLREAERIDDLQFGLKIIQNHKKFCFGTDAVLLSHFASIKRNDLVADLGTGTGIIPILLSAREEQSRLVGLELQADMVEMANRSIGLNNLHSRLEIIEGDIKKAPEMLGPNSFNLVVSNPPYKKGGSGLVNPDDSLAIARHEIMCTLEDVIGAAAGLLVAGGRFAMVHRADRLADIICELRRTRLEPKRIKMVYPRIDRPPNLVLVEAIKYAKPYLKWQPPLIVYKEEGQYTEELLEIYNMTGQ